MTNTRKLVVGDKPAHEWNKDVLALGLKLKEGESVKLEYTVDELKEI
jgi:hypothetical protein